MGRKVNEHNCLAVTHPELAAQLVDASLAHTLSYGSGKKVRWRCDKGHEWETSPNNRTNKAKLSQCPYCIGHHVIVGETDLGTTHPELAAQLVDVELGTQLSHASNKRVRWRCERGHEWEASPNARTTHGSGCPYCSNKKVLIGFNDFATTHPKLAAQMVNPKYAETVVANSTKRFMWCCEKGHKWESTVVNRSRGYGCPYCHGRRVVVGENDLATVYPEIASLLVYPSQAVGLAAHSNERMKWRCENGHIWESTVSHVVAGSRCPYCSNKKLLVGFNDLATVYPELVDLLASPEDAMTIVAGSSKKLRWRCDKGHEWDATAAVRRKGHGCPYCSNQKVLPGFNDLATKYPKLSEQLADINDAVLYVADTGAKLRWRCEKGHEWESTVANRIAGNGCPQCSCCGVSEKEVAFGNMLRQLLPDAEIIEHDRMLIAPYEIDFVIPAHKIAIEFNGTYWHSESVGKDRKYHKRKHDMCCAMGYVLLVIWEDDWDARPDVIRQMLSAKLFVEGRARVFARKLLPLEISGACAREFLERTHIQGYVAATRHFALAANDGTLVAVMSVRSWQANSRMHRQVGDWEVQRYATSCHVVGGFSKLLMYAQKILDFELLPLTRWISFSANELGDGRMYARCGFHVDAELPPDYKYVGAFTHYMRRPKERFQKKRFEQDPGLKYEDGLTERELAGLNNLHRCWDCGKKRWVKDVVR